MEPTFFPGQVIVATRWWRRLGKHDVVIVWHDDMEKIKRIRRVHAGTIWIEGDNSRYSTDSRHFGTVPIQSVVAKVLFGL